MAEGGNAGWSLYSNSQQNLPPKVPSTNVQYPLSLTNAINDHQHGLSDWPRLSQQSTKHQRTSSSIGFLQDTQTPWLDEIVDLPPSKRGGMHRRSASDSLAFGDPQTDVSASIECRDFDKLNEEQFLSMFADIEPFYKNQNLLDFDVMMNVGLLDSQTTPESTSDDLSTPSDYNSIYDTLVDEKPAFASEWGHLKGEHEIPQQNQQEEKQLEQKPSDVNPAGVPDPNLDPKRLKRILANRQSAQRSRVRKLQYVVELERSVNALQTKVSTLSPQVAYLDHQRLVLNVDNSALKQRIAALAQDKLFKDAHCESLKNELQRLRNVYHHQQQCLETEVQRLMVEFDTEHQQMQQGFDINSSLINGMDGNGHQVHSENGEGINISNCSGSNQQFLLPMSCLKDETSTKAYPSDYMVHNS